MPALSTRHIQALLPAPKPTASVAEQLATASLSSTLKFAGLAKAEEEAGWKKLAWALSAGSFEATGWRPDGYVSHEPDGSRSGNWLSTKKQTGGANYVYLVSPTFGASQAGGAPEFRQRSVWLHTTGEGTANGYQLACKDTTVGTSTKYNLRLSKFTGGVATLIKEVEVEIEANGGIALTAVNGKLAMWVRKNETAPWVQVGESFVEGTYTEGYSGIDGNGSNPTMVNFSTGPIVSTTPVVTTEAATETTGISAELHGLVNPKGLATNCWFEWGTTTSYGNKTIAKSAGSGSSNIAAHEIIGELKPATTYHFRLVAENSSGESVGTDFTFTTLGAKLRRGRKPDLALDIEVETPDGTFRLPSDSKKAKNLPRNFSFGTARGEGFGIGSLNLSRDIFKSYPDIGLLDTWRAISRTGKVVYESRLQSNPRTNDPENLLEIALIGWMSYLAGKKISPLILDSRISSWEEPSLQRKKQLNEAGFNLSKMGVSSGWQGEAAGPNEAAIVFTPADWANTKFRAEQWFNGHGEVIAKILYNFLVLVAGGMAEFLTNAAVISTTDTAGSVTEGTNHRTTAASNQSITRTTGDGKYAYIKSLREGGAFVGESGGDSWAFSALKVLGNHGLTLRGTWPEVGFWLTDILRYILGIYYPKVKLAGETNKFVVQQGAWHDSPATGYDIAKQLNNLALWELNMWEDRTLYHEPADLTKYDWQFKTTDPGVKVKFQGDTIENFANGCSVSYTDFDGVPHFLSPHDFPQLRDESEDNPANRHGEDLFTDCDVPYQCNETEALQFGAVYLAEYNRPKRPGSYEIQGGYIKDAAGNWHAGFDPRNGEAVGIMDMLDDEPRLITATQWDDETKVLTITVDAADKLLDAIVARQQIARETRGL